MGTQSFVPPRGPIRRGLRRPLCLANLLDGDLVVHRLARRGLDRPPCFAWTWLSVSPRRLAWRGLSRLPHLIDLLGEELVVSLATQTCSTNGPKRSYGPYLGYLLWYPKHSKSSNLSPSSLSQLSHRYHKGWLGLSSLASSVIICACKLYPYLNINHTENILRLGISNL